MDELEGIRRDIDKIDNELLVLLAKRFECSTKIVAIKKQLQMPVFDGKRENDLLERITHAAKTLGLSKDAAIAIFQEILHQSRRIQEKAR